MRLVLYKRGKIYWARGGRTFRKSTGHTDERKARLVANRWERELADPTSYRAHKATVASAAVRFLTELKVSAKSPETYRFYDPKVQHVIRILGKSKLSELTHDRVLSYTQQREEEGAAKYTVHHELTALRRVLKSAARAGEFGRDFKSVIPEYATGYEPRTEYLTNEEAWRLVRSLRPDRGAAVALVLSTAADYSTAFLMTREDVGTSTVMVRGSKTTSRKRSVPRVAILDPFLAYALEHGEPEGLLLKPWGKMARDMRRACRRLRITEVTAKSLRRTIATWFVQAGVPFDIAAKFLGHSSTAMLFRVYGQLAAADVGRLIDERTVQRMYTDTADKTDDANRTN